MKFRYFFSALIISSSLFSMNQFSKKHCNSTLRPLHGSSDDLLYDLGYYPDSDSDDERYLSNSKDEPDKERGDAKEDLSQAEGSVDEADGRGGLSGDRCAQGSAAQFPTPKQA